MLDTIPSAILTHSATLRVCTSVDVWENPTFEDIPLSRINVQPTHVTVMTKDNTEVGLSSIAFVDARLSVPAGYDFQAAQDTSEANGSPMHLIYQGRDYVVMVVDALCDDTGKYHHTELGLK